jgi:uncharacterized protein involved in exopolysaccharide biosynthesis
MINKNETKISPLHYFILFIKHKKKLIGLTFFAMVLTYLMIFFFVEEQYDATATIIPKQESSLAGLSGMLGNLGELPFDIGGSTSPEIGLYNTILTSRSTTEIVIEKYNLWEIYDLSKSEPKDRKKARERLMGDINTEETDDGAYILTVRMPDSLLSAEITNYLISLLNEEIIRLKVDKSRGNREFLGTRISEIRKRLKQSEDSLMYFQKKSGIINPEEQIKGMISSYSVLEQELFTQQIKKEILEKIYPAGSPQLQNIQLEVEQFQKRFDELKENGKENSIFMKYQSIPSNALDYYRYLREIEINSAILEFVIPLYEQAKIEEQKELPILQVIDYAKPPEEKSYPPRLLLTILSGFCVFFMFFLIVIMRENKELQNSKEFIFIKKNLFKWKTEDIDS